MNMQKILLIVVIVILLMGDLFFAVQYLNVKSELKQMEKTETQQRLNEKVVNFTRLFIKKVLKAEGEIDYETRFRLESAVRDLNDEAVLTQWQKFVDSKTEAEAQTTVKNLLDILADKIAVR